MPETGFWTEMQGELNAIRPDGVAYGRNPRANRVFSAALLACAVGVLLLSRVLQPSALGWGTHEQLLFPPCMFHFFTGLPCPFCGMTTAFAHMARGEFHAALNCHVLSWLFYPATWLVGVGAIYGLLMGRFPLPRFVMSSRFSTGLLVVIAIGWAINLGRVIF